MRAEVIALRLQEVRRQPRTAIAVEERQRRHERRHRDSRLHRLRHHAPPRSLASLDHGCKIPIQQQVAEIRFGRERSLDLAQERAADDAALAPHHGDFAVVQIPLVFLRRLAQHHEPLRVAHDLGSQQRLPDVFHEGFLVALELKLRPRQDLARRHAFFLHGAQAARIHGLADQRHRNPQVQRALAGPFARALLSGGVQNLVHHLLARLGILEAQNVARDFDQVAVQFALVPLGEDLVHLFVAQPQPFLHELVGLADQLHVAVLDAVVRHLHEVPGAVAAHPLAAGLAFGSLGADRLENILHQGPRRHAAARHHRGAEACAFLAATHARADEHQPFALQVVGAPDGVRKVGIAAVDDQIARFQERQQVLDELVHRLARLDHQHDLARPLQQLHHLFDGVSAQDGGAALGCVVQKLIDLGDRPVEGDHRVSVVVHIHNQVLAHDCQTDQSDICRLFHNLLQTRCGTPGNSHYAFVGETLGELRRASRN